MPNNLTFSNTQTYDLIKAGTYEVELEASFRQVESTGRKYIACRFVIRKDLEQEFGGRSIIDKIWEDKVNPGTYDSRKLQKLLLVQGADGKYNFNDYEELVQHLNGFLLRITIVEKEPDDYNENAYNEVKFMSYAKSQALPKQIGGVNQENSNTTAIDVDDSDLPF